MKAKQLLAEAFGMWKGESFLGEQDWEVLSGIIEKKADYLQRFDTHTFRCDPDVTMRTNCGDICYLYKVE